MTTIFGRRASGWTRGGLVGMAVWAAVLGGGLAAFAQSSQEWIGRMVANETRAEATRAHYIYTSSERSERTGGHLWMERVAETDAGKVRLLLAEDGQPLAGERLAAERARLAAIAARPDEFARREQATKNDEHHAHEILTVLPKAFLFDPPSMTDGFTRIAFRPDPAYQPQSMEERVLHGMSGVVLIDPALRLHRIEGRLPEDVNIGFGLLATIKAGSNFSTTRDRVAGEEWKTTVLDTDINGRAIFFKTIGKKEHGEHRDFTVLAKNITVVEAVALLLR